MPWTQRGNLKGPIGVIGPEGPEGDVGPTGPAGSVWYSGTGVPPTGLGVLGDWYLNHANGDVYEKASTTASPESAFETVTLTQSSTGAWSLGVRLRFTVAGEISAVRFWRVAGNPASRPIRVYDASGVLLASATSSESGAPEGWVQVVLPTPLTVAANDERVVVIDIANHAWKYAEPPPASDTPNIVFLGGRYTNATGVFPATTGTSFYGSDVVFQAFVGAAWVLRDNLTGPIGPQGIQGPQGAQGAQGPQGATGQAEAWLGGAVNPTAGQGVAGDWYLNTTTGQVYEKTDASTWTLRATIMGPQGPPGPEGPMGTVYDSDQIATVKTFVGTTIPTNWMLADGRTLQRASYPQLADAMGIPAGQATFTIPDLRDRFIYGHNAPGIGASGGETGVTLAATQMPSHSHSGATGGESVDHAHYVSGQTGAADRSLDHLHGATLFAPEGADWVWVNEYTGGTGVLLRGRATSGMDRSIDHLHGIGLWSGGRNTGHTHGITPEGGGLAHNNMPPYIKIAFIIKVTGAQIDSGGALIGATGAQGPQGIQGPAGTPGDNWFTGSGAPPGATGIVGDWYLNSANGDYYEKTGASTWTLRGNLRGPQGPQGPAGGQVAQTYSVTAGYTKDRALNPEATSLTEVARLLGSLIDDMKASGLIQP
jgi:microcystin-dependent protein